MSSIVSRRPPASGSVNHSNDLRWMSMRLGTSRVLSRRAKERRTRGASTAGTVGRLLLEERKAGRSRRGGPETRGLAKIAQQADAPSGAVDTHGPRPVALRVCGAVPVDGTAATIGRRAAA